MNKKEVLDRLYNIYGTVEYGECYLVNYLMDEIEEWIVELGGKVEKEE